VRIADRRPDTLPVGAGRAAGRWRARAPDWTITWPAGLCASWRVS
jgi:hypothetical protein